MRYLLAISFLASFIFGCGSVGGDSDSESAIIGNGKNIILAYDNQISIINIDDNFEYTKYKLDSIYIDKGKLMIWNDDHGNIYFMGKYMGAGPMIPNNLFKIARTDGLVEPMIGYDWFVSSAYVAGDMIVTLEKRIEDESLQNTWELVERSAESGGIKSRVRLSEIGVNTIPTEVVLSDDKRLACIKIQKVSGGVASETEMGLAVIDLQAGVPIRITDNAGDYITDISFTSNSDHIIFGNFYERDLYTLNVGDGIIVKNINGNPRNLIQIPLRVFVVNDEIITFDSGADGTTINYAEVGRSAIKSSHHVSFTSGYMDMTSNYIVLRSYHDFTSLSNTDYNNYATTFMILHTFSWNYETIDIELNVEYSNTSVFKIIVI